MLTGLGNGGESRISSMDYVWVGLGGLIGANARFVMTRYMADRFGDSYPWGTFAINVAGAFLIGLLLTWLTQRSVADPAMRLVLVVGFLGGYTTFSSYTFEAVTMAQRGNWIGATTYVLGSNVLGLVACVTGIAVARHLHA
jgi:CrcB protein